MNPSLLIVAGESSGDQHGAHLLTALKKGCPDLRCFAAGGPALEAAGAKIAVPMDRLNVMGFFEVASRISGVISSYRTLLETVRENRIDVAILIDFPDFNLFLARALKKRGVRILYYVSPQLWAWRKGRVETIRTLVDRMFVIFPFEETFYRAHGVPVTYEGHPLLDSAFPGEETREPLRQEFFPGSSGLVLALAPGSRRGVVARLFPRMLEAFRILRLAFPDLRALVPTAASVPESLYRTLLTRSGISDGSLRMVAGRFREVMHASDTALVASGTATLETGLTGTPLVVVYAMNPASYRIARLLVKVPAIGMVNLISGRSIVPELIQDQASPDRMANEVGKFLADPVLCEKVRKDLGELRTILGSSGASARIARTILSMGLLDCGPSGVP